MTSIPELIKRLEATTEPDYALDAEIWMTLYPEWRDYPRDDRDDIAWITPLGRSYLSSRYTSSIDDALTLVPVRMVVSISLRDDIASVSIRTGSITNPETKEWQACGLPAIAICIAALKASQS